MIFRVRGPLESIESVLRILRPVIIIYTWSELASRMVLYYVTRPIWVKEGEIGDSSHTT